MPGENTALLSISAQKKVKITSLTLRKNLFSEKINPNTAYKNIPTPLPSLFKSPNEIVIFSYHNTNLSVSFEKILSLSLN